MSCDLCAKCGGAMASSPNYVKQVDPAANNKYGTFFGDSQQESPSRSQRAPAIQMCIPTVMNPQPSNGGHASIIQVPCEPPRECPRFLCEPCPPTSSSPTKVWLIKSSPIPQKVWFNKFLLFLLSFAIAQPPPCIPISDVCFFKHLKSKKKLQSVCLPIGPSSQQECPLNERTMICLQCMPMNPDSGKPKKKLEPIGLITRNKEMDLIGGKLVGGCTCGKKNGLNGEGCPRISCQNNPGCSMNPPMCWPQFREPEPPPPPPPDQELICIPVELVYEEPPC